MMWRLVALTVLAALVDAQEVYLESVADFEWLAGLPGSAPREETRVGVNMSGYDQMLVINEGVVWDLNRTGVVEFINVGDSSTFENTGIDIAAPYLSQDTEWEPIGDEVEWRGRESVHRYSVNDTDSNVTIVGFSPCYVYKFVLVNELSQHGFLHRRMSIGPCGIERTVNAVLVILTGVILMLLSLVTVYVCKPSFKLVPYTGELERKFRLVGDQPSVSGGPYLAADGSPRSVRSDVHLLRDTSTHSTRTTRKEMTTELSSDETPCEVVEEYSEHRMPDSEGGRVVPSEGLRPTSSGHDAASCGSLSDSRLLAPATPPARRAWGPADGSVRTVTPTAGDAAAWSEDEDLCRSTGHVAPEHSSNASVDNATRVMPGAFDDGAPLPLAVHDIVSAVHVAQLLLVGIFAVLIPMLFTVFLLPWMPKSFFDDLSLSSSNLFLRVLPIAAVIALMSFFPLYFVSLYLTTPITRDIREEDLVLNNAAKAEAVATPSETSEVMSGTVDTSLTGSRVEEVKPVSPLMRPSSRPASSRPASSNAASSRAASSHVAPMEVEDCDDDVVDDYHEARAVDPLLLCTSAVDSVVNIYQECRTNDPLLEARVRARDRKGEVHAATPPRHTSQVLEAQAGNPFNPHTHRAPSGAYPPFGGPQVGWAAPQPDLPRSAANPYDVRASPFLPGKSSPPQQTRQAPHPSLADNLGANGRHDVAERKLDEAEAILKAARDHERQLLRDRLYRTRQVHEAGAALPPRSGPGGHEWTPFFGGFPAGPPREGLVGSEAARNDVGDTQQQDRMNQMKKALDDEKGKLAAEMAEKEKALEARLEGERRQLEKERRERDEQDQHRTLEDEERCRRAEGEQEEMVERCSIEREEMRANHAAQAAVMGPAERGEVYSSSVVPIEPIRRTKIDLVIHGDPDTLPIDFETLVGDEVVDKLQVEKVDRVRVVREPDNNTTFHVKFVVHHEYSIVLDELAHLVGMAVVARIVEGELTREVRFALPQEEQVQVLRVQQSTITMCASSPSEPAPVVVPASVVAATPGTSTVKTIEVYEEVLHHSHTHSHTGGENPWDYEWYWVWRDLKFEDVSKRTIVPWVALIAVLELGGLGAVAFFRDVGLVWPVAWIIVGLASSVAITVVSNAKAHIGGAMIHISAFAIVLHPDIAGASDGVARAVWPALTLLLILAFTFVKAALIKPAAGLLMTSIVLLHFAVLPPLVTPIATSLAMFVALGVLLAVLHVLKKRKLRREAEGVEDTSKVTPGVPLGVERGGVIVIPTPPEEPWDLNPTPIVATLIPLAVLHSAITDVLSIYVGQDIPGYYVFGPVWIAMYVCARVYCIACPTPGIVPRMMPNGRQKLLPWVSNLILTWAGYHAYREIETQPYVRGIFYCTGEAGLILFMLLVLSPLPKRPKPTSSSHSNDFVTTLNKVM